MLRRGCPCRTKSELSTHTKNRPSPRPNKQKKGSELVWDKSGSGQRGKWEHSRGIFFLLRFPVVSLGSGFTFSLQADHTKKKAPQFVTPRAKKKKHLQTQKEGGPVGRGGTRPDRGKKGNANSPSCNGPDRECPDRGGKRRSPCCISTQKVTIQDKKGRGRRDIAAEEKKDGGVVRLWCKGP